MEVNQIIVRRWDGIVPHPAPLNHPYSACQYASTNFGWAKLVGNSWVDGSTEKGGWDRDELVAFYQRVIGTANAHTRDELWPLFERRVLPPSWCAPGWENWPNDPVVGAASSSPDRCKYGLMPIAGVSEVWSPYIVKDFNGRAQTVQRFSAPIEQQERESTDRVIRAALRTLREVPLCNVTGQPVNVIAMPRNLTMQAYFKCENCK